MRLLNTLVLELGRRIRARRLRLGMTQEELAERSALHYTYIGQIERGEKNLTVSSLEKIVAALDITFCDLFENMQPAARQPGYAAQCYALVDQLPVEKQAQVYALLCDVLKMI